MKNLYNIDGALSIEARTLLSLNTDVMSTPEWKTKVKQFRDQLTEEDFKEFVCLYNSAYQKAYRKANKEKIEKYDELYRIKNKNKINERSKRYHEKNKQTINARYKDYHQKNKQTINARAKERRKTNKKAYLKKPKTTQRAVCSIDKKEKRKEYLKKPKTTQRAVCSIDKKEKRKEYKRKERQTVRDKLRRAVHSAFTRIKKDKPANTLELLGCTWEEAKAHIESLFTEGMTWENHGTYGWHIDHIRPVSSFKGDELHLMNRIENLQPLWWQDNLSKSDKYQSSQCHLTEKVIE